MSGFLPFRNKEILINTLGIILELHIPNNIKKWGGSKKRWKLPHIIITDNVRVFGGGVLVSFSKALFSSLMLDWWPVVCVLLCTVALVN